MTFSLFFLTIISLGGSQGECWCLSQQHTGKSRIVTSSLVLCEHLEDWELAQENVGNALKVFWHLPIVPAFHFPWNWFVFRKNISEFSFEHLSISGEWFSILKEEVILYLNVRVSQGQESPTSTLCTPSQSLCSDDVWDSISPGLPQEHDSVVALLSHNGDWWDSSCSLHFVYNWN